MNEIIGIIVTSICGYIVYLLKDLTESKKIENNATRLLLRCNIRQIYGACKHRGFITSDELAEATDLYRIYSKMHGNGVVTHMMNYIEGLELKEGDEDDSNAK